MMFQNSGPARYAGPEVSELTPAQVEVHHAICSGPRGHVVGPLKVWLTNPQMAQASQALGQYARYDSVLPPELSELAILVTGRYWSSGFEWGQHAPIALDVGVPSLVVETIAKGKRPEFDDPRMSAVFEFAVELHRDKQVSDAAYDRVERLMGKEGAVDLVAICGYYTLISMTINAFRLPNESGPALPELTCPAHKLFIN